MAAELTSIRQYRKCASLMLPLPVHSGKRDDAFCLYTELTEALKTLLDKVYEVEHDLVDSDFLLNPDFSGISDFRVISQISWISPQNKFK